MKKRLIIQLILLILWVTFMSPCRAQENFLGRKEKTYSKKVQIFSAKKEEINNHRNDLKVVLDPTDPESPEGGGGETTTDYLVTSPCEKMKIQNTDKAFKDNVSELDKKEIFNKDQEIGVAVAYGPQTKYEYLTNTENENLKLQREIYFGYIHTHLDSKEGVVKIFSPTDVSTFLTICVRNADAQGTMSDAFGMVITSQGNYILKYSGDGNYSIGPETIKGWNSWYEKEYDQLSQSELANSSVVEKLFAQFLEEKVKLDGLEVYKSDKITGKTSKLKYNGRDKPVRPIPCTT